MTITWLKLQILKVLFVFIDEFWVFMLFMMLWCLAVVLFILLTLMAMFAFNSYVIHTATTLLNLFQHLKTHKLIRHKAADKLLWPDLEQPCEEIMANVTKFTDTLKGRKHDWHCVYIAMSTVKSCHLCSRTKMVILHGQLLLSNALA